MYELTKQSDRSAMLPVVEPGHNDAKVANIGSLLDPTKTGVAKTTTLDEALLETLRVRTRLVEGKLVLFTQLRFQRDTKAAKRPPEKDVLANKPVKRKVVRKPLPKERCYFPAVAADAFERARRAIEKRFEVVASTPGSVAFRWRHAPDLGRARHPDKSYRGRLRRRFRH